MVTLEPPFSTLGPPVLAPHERPSCDVDEVMIDDDDLSSSDVMVVLKLVHPHCELHLCQGHRALHPGRAVLLPHAMPHQMTCKAGRAAGKLPRGFPLQPPYWGKSADPAGSSTKHVCMCSRTSCLPLCHAFMRL